MMKTWLLCVCLFGFVLPALAQDAMRADSSSGGEDEVKKLELDLAQMVVHGDWDEYARHLMDDFERTSGSGATEDKAAAMAQLRSGSEKILDLAPEELKVRVYGDTAILTGHFTLVQRRNGRVDTFFARQTDVFLKRGGRWLLAASHSTSVAK
jgi:ketosteroid isomerase-like protein